MIHPSPTGKIAPHLARGTLASMHEATATKAAYVVIEFPNSSYQTHLVPVGTISSAIGKRIIGAIHVDARRVDRVDTGGSYLEPVFGRPRRVQGRVISTDDKSNVVLVDASVPIHLRITAPNQSASDFQPGVLVSCDVLDGATFTPAAD